MKLQIKYWNNDNRGCECKAIEIKDGAPLLPTLRGTLKGLREHYANIEIYSNGDKIASTYNLC